MKEKSKEVLSIRMKSDTLGKVKEIAKRRNMTLSEYCRAMITIEVKWGDTPKMLEDIQRIQKNLNYIEIYLQLVQIGRLQLDKAFMDKIIEDVDRITGEIEEE